MVFVANATPEVDAQSQYATIIAICVVMSALATVIVCARLFIRKKNNRIAGDDWMSILSLIFAIAYSILCIVRTYRLSESVRRLRPCLQSRSYTAIVLV